MTSPSIPSTAKRVDVFASRPLEARLRALNLYDGFRFPGDDQVSQETQQLENTQVAAALAIHEENTRCLLKAEKPTGTPHLFVLDPEELSYGDREAHATLQALANSKFSDATAAAVAMLPPETGFNASAQHAIDLLKGSILADDGVTTLESVEELQAWLDRVSPKSAPSDVGEVS